MSRFKLSLIFSLARRFFRSRHIRSVAIGTAAVVILLTGIGSTLKALDLAPEQVVEQNLGTYNAKVDLTGTVDLAAGERLDRGWERSAAANSSDVAVEIYSTDIRLGGSGGGFAPFIEASWQSAPFPDRYALSAGRWGSAPGEIVLTNPSPKVKLGEEPDVLSGNTNWRVVGFASDQYGEFSSMLAPPGTWAELEPAKLSDFRVLEAYPRLYGSGADDSKLLAAASGLIEVQANQSSTEKIDPASLIQTRDTISDVARRTAGEKAPMAYLIPLILFPILVVLLPLTLFEREFHYRFSLLRELGVGRLQSWAGLWTALLGWLMIGGLAGCVGGALLALATRTLLAAFHPLPLSPMASIWVPSIQATLIAALAAAVGLAVIARGSRSKAGRSQKSRIQLPNELWWSTLFVLIAAVVVESFTLESLQRWMILMGTIAGLVAISGGRLARMTARMLQSRSVTASSLALRKMSDPAGRSGALVATIAVGTGLACGMLILAASVVSSGKSESTPNVRPGQVAVNGVGGMLEPATPAVQQRVSRELSAMAESIKISYLGSIDEPIWARDDGYGFVGVFESVEQLERFFPNGLSPSAVAKLKSGQAIHWDDQQGDRRLNGADQDAPRVVSSELVDAPPVRWSESIVVAMLEDGAGSLGFPIADGATVYDGVSRAEAERMERMLQAEGLDPDQFETYALPTTPAPPLLITLTAISLLLLLFSTTLFAVRTQVDSLRSVFATALAVGLAPGWCRRVALIELALSTLVATLLALAIGAIPALVASIRISGLDLDVPWLAVSALFMMVYATGLFASALAFRDLSPEAQLRG